MRAGSVIGRAKDRRPLWRATVLLRRGEIRLLRPVRSPVCQETTQPPHAFELFTAVQTRKCVMQYLMVAHPQPDEVWL